MRSGRAPACEAAATICCVGAPDVLGKRAAMRSASELREGRAVGGVGAGENARGSLVRGASTASDSRREEHRARRERCARSRQRGREARREAQALELKGREMHRAGVCARGGGSASSSTRPHNGIGAASSCPPGRAPGKRGAARRGGRRHTFFARPRPHPPKTMASSPTHHYSALQRERLLYVPEVPTALVSAPGVVPLSTPADDAGLASSFSVSSLAEPIISFASGAGASPSSTPLRVGVVFCGRQCPGGHNVVSGIYDALSSFAPGSTLIGFMNGEGHARAAGTEHDCCTAHQPLLPPSRQRPPTPLCCSQGRRASFRRRRSS